jgi:hypothetical protein
MDFKFSVGQAVEYTPRGGTVGLYTVVQQMPEELQVFERRYRIKNLQEGFQRTVLEYDLGASDKQPEDFPTSSPLRRNRGKY